MFWNDVNIHKKKKRKKSITSSFVYAYTVQMNFILRVNERVIFKRRCNYLLLMENSFLFVFSSIYKITVVVCNLESFHGNTHDCIRQHTDAIIPKKTDIDPFEWNFLSLKMAFNVFFFFVQINFSRQQ